MSIKALFSHKDIFTRGGFPIFNYLKDEKNTVLKKVVRTFIKTGRGGSKAIYKLYKKTGVLVKVSVPNDELIMN